VRVGRVVLGLALWPLLLPLLALAPMAPVVDPRVRGRALEKVRRINTEIDREQLERSFQQR